MTLLKDADEVYLGGRAVSRMYSGADQAWPAFNPPATYTTGLYNQLSTENARTGCVIEGFGETEFGDIQPRKAQGLKICRLAINSTAASSPGQVNLRCGPDGNTQIPGVTAISLTFSDGAPGVTLSWNATGLCYRGTSAALYTFMATPANLNRVIGVKNIPVSGPAVSALLSHTQGANRTDAVGDVGMRITIGATPIKATWLGAKKASGGGGSRTLRLYNWTSGALLATATVNLDLTTTNNFMWGAITPVVLMPGASYAIMVDTASNNRWTDIGPAAVTPLIASVSDAIKPVAGALASTGTANQSYGPVDIGWDPGPPPTITQSLFGSEAPANSSLELGQYYTLGTVFKVTAPGTITHVRVYRSPGSSLPNCPVAIYGDNDPLSLAYVPGGMFTGPGWNEIALPTPLAVVPGVEYLVAFFTAEAAYGYTSHRFDAQVTSGTLFAPADAAVGNGRFKAGSPTMAIPENSFNATWYGVDVVLV